MKWFYSGWAVVVTICLLTTVKILDPTPLLFLKKNYIKDCVYFITKDILEKEIDFAYESFS